MGGMTMRALILGDTGGIGAALAHALRADGTEVTGLSRSRDGFDVTDEGTVAAAARRLEGGTFGLIVNATGALSIEGAAPEKTIAVLDPAVMAAQFAVNATGVALVLKHFAPLLARVPTAVLASLSARVGSIGDNRAGGWISYRAAKAAQNQILRTAAIEIASRNPAACVVAIHPGTVVTPLTDPYRGRHPARPAAQAARDILDVIAALTPADTGSFRDWKGETVPW